MHGHKAMVASEVYDTLIGHIYDAVFDESAWLPMVQKVDVVLGTNGCHLALFDPDSADPRTAFSRLYKDGAPAVELEETYLKEYLPIDERVPRLADMPTGEPRHNQQLFTRDERRRTSATYNDFLVSVGGANQICVRLPNSGCDRDVWTITREASREYGSDERAAIRGLAGHMGRMVRMRRALSAAGALGQDLAEMLDYARGGVFVLDAAGWIVECNRRARSMLKAGAGLDDTDGVLRATSKAANDVLRVAMLRAARGSSRSEASAIRIPTNGDRWLSVHVSPLSRTAEMLKGRAAMVAVVLDPWSVPELDLATVRDALGVTASEAEVAVLLAQGRTVDEMAAQRHRSVASVRWHLKQLYAKTGVGRQADLVRVVMGLVGPDFLQPASRASGRASHHGACMG